MPKNSPMSWIYVYDNDDWERTQKTARCSNPFFTSSGTGLQIFSSQISNKFPTDQSTLTFNCSVTGTDFTQVSAQVIFSNIDIDFNEVFDVPFIRILGTTVDDFMHKNSTTDTNSLDTLKGLLTSTFKLSTKDQLIIITVRNYNKKLPKSILNSIPLVDSATFGVEVYFLIVQNNIRLSSLKTNFLIKANLNAFTSIFSIDQFGDQCPKDTNFCPANSFCKSIYVLLSQQRLVADGNATAFVGMNSLVDTECFCNLDPEPKTCLNNGIIYSSANDF